MCYIQSRRRAIRQRDGVFDSESKDPALLVNMTELRLPTTYTGYWQCTDARSSGMKPTFTTPNVSHEGIIIQPSSLSLCTAQQYRKLSFKERSIAKWSQRYQNSYIFYLPITDSILVEPSQVPNFIQSISLPPYHPSTTCFLHSVYNQMVALVPCAKIPSWEVGS